MIVMDLIARAPVVVAPEETVAEAAHRMKECDVGSVLVVDETGVTGILTDRDLVLTLVEHGPRVWDEPVGEVMTPWPVTISLDADIESCIDTMLSYGVRRIPVIDGAGDIVGVVSLDDVLIHVANTLSSVAGLVRGAVLGVE